MNGDLIDDKIKSLVSNSGWFDDKESILGSILYLNLYLQP